MIHTAQTHQIGDNVELMREMDAESIDTIITSPPYWGLRDYGVDGQTGLESTLEEYHARMLEVTAECMRVLKPTGVMFWNHGDSYGGSWQNHGAREGKQRDKNTDSFERHGNPTDTYPVSANIPAKCMLMQNERLIIRMIDDQGWVLRNRIIWNKPNGMPSSVTDRFSNKYEPVYMLVKNKPRSNDIKTFIEPPIPSDWRSWLAAIIDCEGTVGIRRSKMKDKHDTFGAYITVSNTNEEMVNRCMELTGLGTVRNHPGTNFKMYRWEVTHQMAISVIGEIYQYLIDKKEQAKVAIALQKTNVHRGNNKNTNRGPAPISEKEYKLKESLWELIKTLNQKDVGNSGLPDPNLDRYGGCEDYWFDLDAVRKPYTEPMNRWGGQKLKADGDSKYTDNDVHGGYRERDMRPNTLGKNPGDVWTIPTQPYSEAHFATFPTALIEPMIKAACPEGGTVLDPFCGSGTVLEVCRLLNRNAIGLELNPDYEALIKERSMSHTPPLTAY